MQDRFWDKVQKTDACWLWTGAANNGYGIVRDGRRTRRASHVSWEMMNGPVPDDLCVLHRCDVPACVRPDHLFVGTHADNIADKIAKGRAHRSGRLSDQDVRVIRWAYQLGARPEDLAPQFGIAARTAWDVVMGVTWKTVV